MCEQGFSNVVFSLIFDQCERTHGFAHYEGAISQNNDINNIQLSIKATILYTFGCYRDRHVTMVSGMPCCMNDLAWLRGTQTNTSGLVSGDT